MKIVGSLYVNVDPLAVEPQRHLDRRVGAERPSGDLVLLGDLGVLAVETPPVAADGPDGEDPGLRMEVGERLLLHGVDLDRRGPAVRQQFQPTLGVVADEAEPMRAGRNDAIARARGASHLAPFERLVEGREVRHGRSRSPDRRCPVRAITFRSAGPT